MACRWSRIDVLVVGGGTAGTIAAIQAARSGARALLIERGTQLGGTMTIAVSAILIAASAMAGDYYVAPDGSDTNPGTKAKPFAAVATARDAVRKLTAAGLKEDVTVWLRGGVYELAEPLVFGPEDSGTEKFSVTYAAAPGGKPVISGGRKITGWKTGEDGRWTVEIPEVRAGKLYFRGLFVNDRRAVRARLPNVSDNPPAFQLRGANLNTDTAIYTYSFPPGMLQNWRNLSDVEYVGAGNWESIRKLFQTVNPGAATATMAGPHIPHPSWGSGFYAPSAGRWSHIENVYEALDAPGEWYLDRKTGVLTYLPRAGEDPRTAVVIAPRLERLLDVRGATNQPVRNLNFRGIGFLHTDWPLPPGGYFGMQACRFVQPEGGQLVDPHMDAALRWDQAVGCSVRDGALAHLGGGIEWISGCFSNVLEGNDIFDIGGNGVMLGGPQDEAFAPKGNRIANNHIRDCGIDYYGAVGIWVGIARNTVIAHNLIHGLPYTGISMGWKWDSKPTAARENVVEYNHIYDVMNRLSDGGGLYTLGFQPGTVIRGNHIHDVHRSPLAHDAGNNGMFIDEGSKGFLFVSNFVCRASEGPVRFNMCSRDGHTWADNVFLDVPPKTLTIPHAASLEPERLTIEAWVRLEGFPAGTDPRRWIAGKNDNEWVEGHYALVLAGKRIGAYLNIGGGQTNALAAFSDKEVLKFNQRQHLAMTYDGATLKVYCDGALAASKAVNRKRVPGNGPFAIGIRPDGYQPVEGAGIEDVRLYDRAFAPDEMAARIKGGDVPAGCAGTWLSGVPPSGAGAAIEAAAGLEPAFRKKSKGDVP